MAAARRKPRTVLPRQFERSPVWTAAILLGALVSFYALLAVYMARDHAWADRVLAGIPIPSSKATLAADAALRGQVRVVASSAWYTDLSDGTKALVAEAKVVNESTVPVGRIVAEARADAPNKVSRTRSAVCAGAVSRRLLGRMPVNELETLQELAPSLKPIDPGDSVSCQIAFPHMTAGAEEVVLRIAWVEPFPGHPPPGIHPGG